MYGTIQNSATGAMRNEVSGAAAASKVIARPKTRPCFSNGTTRWITVCSAASIAGISSMNTQMPAMNSHAQSRSASTEPTMPSTPTATSMVRTGFDPSPNRATSAPPAMKPVPAMPNTMPHISTENRVRPYGSSSAMCTPLTRLLNIEKRMRPKSPGTARIAAMPPRKSTAPLPGSGTVSASSMRSR